LAGSPLVLISLFLPLSLFFLRQMALSDLWGILFLLISPPLSTPLKPSCVFFVKTLGRRVWQLFFRFLHNYNIVGKLPPGWSGVGEARPGCCSRPITFARGGETLALPGGLSSTGTRALLCRLSKFRMRHLAHGTLTDPSPRPLRLGSLSFSPRPFSRFPVKCQMACFPFPSLFLCVR